jgi:hypothetical protein
VNIAFWLGRLASQFGQWAGRMDGIANQIGGVPILGPYLSGGFRGLASYMRQAFSDTVQVQFAANDIVNKITQAANALLNFEVIRYIVTTIRDFFNDPAGRILSYIAGRVSYWSQFTSDPVGWVRTRLQSLGGTVSQWLNDPAGWVRDRLTGLYGHVSQFLTDPAGWLRARVIALAGHVATFLTAPAQFVRDQFMALLPFASSFFGDPAGWVRDRLVAATGLTLSFFADPFGWVRDRLFGTYPALRDLLTFPAVTITRYVVDGLEDAIEAYKARLLKVAERAISSLF